MPCDSSFLWDSMVKDKRVLCSGCALARNGLVTQTPVYLEMFTDREKYDGFSLGVGRYLYNPDIDYVNYVCPMDSNRLILLPTKERAIVEYVKFEKWCDEGLLIEALKTYDEYKPDYDLLFFVADFFGVASGVMKQWIIEAREDMEV